MQPSDLARRNVALILILNLRLVLTLILGFVNLFNSRATITWPDHFFDDVNKDSWRATIFSFTPAVFSEILVSISKLSFHSVCCFCVSVDKWTPVVFGLVRTRIGKFVLWIACASALGWNNFINKRLQGGSHQQNFYPLPCEC